MKALKIGEGTDIVSLTDDQNEILFGPEVERKSQDGSVRPFYINLNILENILHNSMLNFGAAHNLMPRVIMENLGLEIKKTLQRFIFF